MVLPDGEFAFAGRATVTVDGDRVDPDALVAATRRLAADRLSTAPDRPRE